MRERIVVIKNRVIREVVEQFPASYTDMAELADLEQAVSSLDTETQDAVHGQRSSIEQRGKILLTKKLAADEEHKTIPVSISDGTLLGTINDVREELQVQVNDLVAEIRQSLPVSRVRIVSAAVLKRVKIERPVAEDTTTPQAKEQVIELNRILKGIRSRKLVATLAAKLATTDVLSEQEQDIATSLAEHYAKIAQAEAHKLSQTLIELYEAALYHQTQQAKREADLTTSIGQASMSQESAVSEEKDTTSTYAKKEDKNELKREANIPITIGEIDSPFPWLDNAKIKISVRQENGVSLVFCEAMSPLHQEVSSELRKTKENGVAFDSLWEYTQKLTLNHAGGSHRVIKNLGHTDHPDYKNIVVLSPKSRSTSRRIYYSRTRCATFPPLAQFVAKNGLSSETNLVILLAETDKHNQHKVINRFRA